MGSYSKNKPFLKTSIFKFNQLCKNFSSDHTLKFLNSGDALNISEEIESGLEIRLEESKGCPLITYLVHFQLFVRL